MTPALRPTTPDGLWQPDGDDLVVHGDALEALRGIPDGVFRLAYLDPPFNSGRRQTRQSVKAIRSASGGRIGFQGRSYETVKGRALSYADRFEDYWAFLEPRLAETRRVLADDGALFLHLDAGEVHYARVALDALFGADAFVNELVWAYDYGARSRRRWPAKHDNILVYAKDPSRLRFDVRALAGEAGTVPGASPAEREAAGLPSDVWWHTIVSTTGREKTGYPTQKPVGVLRRIVQAASEPGDWVLDAFAGSGTTAAVAQAMDRRFVMVDSNEAAVEVMHRRLGAGILGASTAFARLVEGGSEEFPGSATTA
ncbi:DNA-methyltransferase [Agromyces archimandritae]|uniref:DNA-methyltransferase n=1 Tax=Agromyces archimandritae TaxID=2781962 RepID=UPI001FD4407E|nr:site-specific DNA-methyltransferase [Agromyces archimandritae]